MEKQTIQPFITVANYHFIEQQMHKILQALATTKDKDVISAVRDIVDGDITATLMLSEAEEQLIRQVSNVTSREQGEAYLEQLKPYVVPFKAVTANAVKSLFKKEKKLKLPKLEEIDFQQVCYLAWNDLGTHRRYVIIEQDDQLKAIKGTFSTNTIKGVCSICNRLSDVNLFTTSVKGRVAGTFKNHSNYICADSQECNQHVTDVEKMQAFFERMTQ